MAEPMDQEDREELEQKLEELANAFYEEMVEIAQSGKMVFLHD